MKHDEAMAGAADSVFGGRAALARQYADLLAGAGVERGLIGPREVPRIWERHLLNCAAVADLLAAGDSVVDIGSGAGLPGIPLAIARPDLAVTLLEPMQRRIDFLREVVGVLGVDVTVVRARAEEKAFRAAWSPVDTAVSRAVAPLDRMAEWALPLVRQGGRMLAIKGASAPEELAIHRTALRRRGGDDGAVVACGSDLLDTPTTVIVVRRLSPHRDTVRRRRVRKDQA